MKLIGSITSPYVRRVRILLENQDYDFELINVFSPEGQKRMKEITTTGRVPLFIDNDKVIWDSMLICEYLLQKQGKEISLEQKLKLVEINEASDSAITLFQLKKFNLDNSWSNEFSQLQLQRIDRVLADFDKTYRSPKWEIQDMWLYCFLDWLDFRQVFSWREKFKNLVGFMNAHKDKFILQQTDPRG